MMRPTPASLLERPDCGPQRADKRVSHDARSTAAPAPCWRHSSEIPAIGDRRLAIDNDRPRDPQVARLQPQVALDRIRDRRHRSRSPLATHGAWRPARRRWFDAATVSSVQAAIPVNQGGEASNKRRSSSYPVPPRLVSPTTRLRSRTLSNRQSFPQSKMSCVISPDGFVLTPLQREHVLPPMGAANG